MERIFCIMMQKLKKSQRLIELESESLSAIAQKTRLKLIYILKDGPKCLCEIAPMMDEDMSTISRHLNILKSKGFLDVKKNGVRVIYSIKDNRVFDILDIVDEFIKSEIKEKEVLFSEVERCQKNGTR